MGANRVKFLMIVLLLKLFSWYPIANASPPPCIDSSNECVNELINRAIALLAAKAELERQQEEEKVEIGDKVLHLLLDYESAFRRYELLSS